MTVPTSLGRVEITTSGDHLAEHVLIFPGGHCPSDVDLGWDLLERAGFGVISVARPGYGQTDVGKLEAGAFVPAVSEALAALGIQRLAAVQGISFGGMQAVEFAITGAPRPGALILAHAAPSSLAFPDSRREAALAPLVFGPRVETRLWAMVRALVASDRGLRLMASSLSTLPARTWWSTWSPDDRGRARRLFGAMRSREGFLIDLSQAGTDRSEQRAARLSDVDLPTLVIASPYDGSVSLDHARDFVARIRRARLHLDGSPSHLFWLGPMATKVGQVITDFIEDPDQTVAAGPQHPDAGLPQRDIVDTADGRTLTTYSWGEGDDVVVLEAGAGFGGRYWGRRPGRWRI